MIRLDNNRQKEWWFIRWFDDGILRIGWRFSEEEDSFEIITDPKDLADVREGLEKMGVPMVQSEVTKIPQTFVELHKEDDIKNMNRILDLLEEDDDVQEVYHNWDM